MTVPFLKKLQACVTAVPLQAVDTDEHDYRSVRGSVSAWPSVDEIEEYGEL